MSMLEGYLYLGARVLAARDLSAAAAGLGYMPKYCRSQTNSTDVRRTRPKQSKVARATNPHATDPCELPLWTPERVEARLRTPRTAGTGRDGLIHRGSSLAPQKAVKGPPGRGLSTKRGKSKPGSPTPRPRAAATSSSQARSAHDLRARAATKGQSGQASQQTPRPRAAAASSGRPSLATPTSWTRAATKQQWRRSTTS